MASGSRSAYRILATECTKKLRAILKKIFQGDTSHETNGNGLGLGLAFAARIADICKGKIRVESKQGKKSLFYFEF